MGKTRDQGGRYSGTCKQWMADGREKYWNGIREYVKESKEDRVDDGLMN
jgi:hypothetical protein